MLMWWQNIALFEIINNTGSCYRIMSRKLAKERVHLSNLVEEQHEKYTSIQTSVFLYGIY